jgi:hypothetical protein
VGAMKYLPHLGCSLLGVLVGLAFHKTPPVVERHPDFAPWDAGSNVCPALHSGLRRDPLRVCWQQVAPSGNAGPEECITDAALHRLEMGLPIDHEPTIALWRKTHGAGLEMTQVDGGPVWDLNVTWTDQDGPLRVCAHIKNNITGAQTSPVCRTRAELLGELETHDSLLMVKVSKPAGTRL